MNPSSFDNAPGELLSIPSRSGKDAWAFLPNPLPPELESSHEITAAVARATLALGNLNGVGLMLTNPLLLIRPFIQREALASSRIEGTQADYGQLVLLEAEGMSDPDDPDLEEVTNYIRALYTGWNRPEERPFSPGFLMELHSQLLDGVRGHDRNPGRLREIQVVIGSSRDDAATARFVPPPPETVRGLVDDLCAYIVTPSEHASPIRLALIHYQFETIHPFEDGNGRLGRLLLPLILGLWGELDLPLLYLSEYLEDHRDEYIERLYRVSSQSDWTGWILFMLEAIEQQALDSYHRIRRLYILREDMRERYQGGRSAKLLTVIDHLFDRPSLTVKSTQQLLSITPRAAGLIIDRLVQDGVLEEVTGQSRNRIFVSRPIMDLMFSRNSHV